MASPPASSPDASTSSAARRKPGIVILLLLVAAGLRFASIDHGLPERHVPDTSMVRQALGMARDKHPVPPVGKYSTYPNLVPYALLPIYAGHFALGRIDGSWSGTQEYAAQLTRDPSPAHRLARMLVALFGVATVLVVLRAARAAGLERGAFVAAWLVATGLLHVHFSVQERPWVPMVFFFALAAWAAIRHEREGSRRSLLLCGVAAGLAFASHQAGLPALGLPAFAWLFGPRSFRGRDLQRRLIDGVLCVALFVLAGVLVGHPYLLLYGPTPDVAVVPGEAAGPEGIAVGGQSFAYRFRLASLTRLSKTFFAYDPVLTGLALLGLVPFALRRGGRAVTAFAVMWGAVFFTHHNDHVRYLLPLSVLLALPAGALCDRWRLGRGSAVVLSILLTVPLIQALRFDQVLSRADLREAAALGLAELPQGARVAVDRYGPRVQRDDESLELLEELRALRGEELYRREAQRLEDLRSGVLAGGTAAVYVEDVFEFEDRLGEVRVRAELAPRAGETVDGALQRLGCTHLLLVNRRYARLEEHQLAGLVEGREPLLELSPLARGSFREAWLPLEMEFPLVELWKVERPGPWMGLYELAR